VELRSSMALCHPSLDEHPIAESNVVEYREVEPGKHTVYCALQRSGPKQRVGDIDVKPGKKVTPVIKVTDGKPHF
jgi:hypothetical protein